MSHPVLRLTAPNRWTRWSILIALVLSTLAPGLAHALRHSRGEAMPWSQICSATGARRVISTLDAQGRPAERDEAGTMCTACAGQGGQAPPAARSALPGLGVDGAPVGAAATPAHPARHVHSPALPRAPPASARERLAYEG